MDIDNMRVGLDFVEQIEQAVQKCDVLIAVIGKGWLTAKNEKGQRRLDNPHDFVRVEIQAALDRDIPVVPLLVGGAEIPKASDLPDTLSKLSRRHAMKMSDERFRIDADRLIAQISDYVLKRKSQETNAGAKQTSRNARNNFFQFLAIALVGSLLIIITVWRFATKELSKEIEGKDGAPMVLVSAGTFTMGSPDGEGAKDEHPQHDVYLKDFYLDQYEVTVKRYQQFMNENNREAPAIWEQVELKRDAQKPVVGIGWQDAHAYCQWAGKRLPTEAEWEKAARGTDKRTYPWGNEEPSPNITNFGMNYEREKVYELQLQEVGTYEGGKSPYGAYDMAGNVGEWVQDWYAEEYYQMSPRENPSGPSTGEDKVLRGGSWVGVPEYLRASFRLWGIPTIRVADSGVRCAQDAR